MDFEILKVVIKAQNKKAFESATRYLKQALLKVFGFTRFEENSKSFEFCAFFEDLDEQENERLNFMLKVASRFARDKINIHFIEQ